MGQGVSFPTRVRLPGICILPSFDQDITFHTPPAHLLGGRGGGEVFNTSCFDA